MFGEPLGEWPIGKETVKVIPKDLDTTPKYTEDIDHNFDGVEKRKPPKKYSDQILASTKENKVDPSLVAAILIQESGYNPKPKDNPSYDKAGNIVGYDRGIAQINSYWHPEVTDEQAYDPIWAIAWLTRQLKSDIDYFGDINRGLAAYNVGRGGANVKGKELFGGGPKGQTYIDNVARNLTEEQRKKLGLKTTY